MTVDYDTYEADFSAFWHDYLQPGPHELAFEQLLKVEALKLVPFPILHSDNYKRAISACREFYNSIDSSELEYILHTRYPEYFL